jgi:hypothetical protein
MPEGPQLRLDDVGKPQVVQRRVRLQVEVELLGEHQQLQRVLIGAGELLRLRLRGRGVHHHVAVENQPLLQGFNGRPDRAARAGSHTAAGQADVAHVVAEHGRFLSGQGTVGIFVGWSRDSKPIAARSVMLNPERGPTGHGRADFSNFRQACSAPCRAALWTAAVVCLTMKRFFLLRPRRRWRTHRRDEPGPARREGKLP